MYEAHLEAEQSQRDSSGSAEPILHSGAIVAVRLSAWGIGQYPAGARVGGPWAVVERFSSKKTHRVSDVSAALEKEPGYWISFQKPGLLGHFVEWGWTLLLLTPAMPLSVQRCLNEPAGGDPRGSHVFMYVRGARGVKVPPARGGASPALGTAHVTHPNGQTPASTHGDISLRKAKTTRVRRWSPHCHMASFRGGAVARERRRRLEIPPGPRRRGRRHLRQRRWTILQSSDWG